ncbi:flagellar export protein FliJ [Sanguibacter sp. A247]|uniref:flagellar export protein FliJ n=1 Tax=unclassified Sanguibacter TaxID=2645534 RepID=UPI003FD78D48
MSGPFRLAALLRVRRLQEDQAAADLARAHGVVSDAQKRSAQATARLAGSTFDTSVPVSVWQALAASRAAMRRDLSDADALVAVHRAAARVAEEAWLAARGRVKTFERLEERHDAEVAADELAEEQKALDEAAGRTKPNVGPSEKETR